MFVSKQHHQTLPVVLPIALPTAPIPHCFLADARRVAPGRDAEALGDPAGPSDEPAEGRTRRGNREAAGDLGSGDFEHQI